MPFGIWEATSLVSFSHFKVTTYQRLNPFPQTLDRGNILSLLPRSMFQGHVELISHVYMHAGNTITHLKEQMQHIEL